MWQDFKAFLLRGNVIDLAVAVIIGAAFTKIVTTISEGIISPVIGLLTGGIDFKSKYIVLSGTIPPAATPEEIAKLVKAGTVNILQYGQLLNDIINFVIVGIVLFFIVRWFSKYLKFMEAAAPTPPSEILLAEIRDLLKNKPTV